MCGFSGLLDPQARLDADALREETGGARTRLEDVCGREVVLFAYPHVRYLARYYPIFVLLLLMALERLAAANGPGRRPALVAATACLAFSLVENGLRLAAGIGSISQAGVYWFPD